MVGRDERHPPSDSPAVPVPQLIEKYRAQREAWMAQADELARLRDEVRGSAEREAMEIVTTARRDIRQIVMEARRELFVLSAQVQAALGDGGPGAPQLGPPAIAHDDDRISVDQDLAAFAQEEWGFAPRSTVAAVLEEARHDIEVLDKDARAVPSGAPAATPPRTPVGGASAATAGAAAVEAPQPVAAAPSPIASPAETAAAPSPFPTALRESLVMRDTPSTRVFAALFAAAALVLVTGTAWMLRGPADGTDDAAAAGAPAVAASSPASSASVSPDAAKPEPPTSVTVSIEAVRPAWIRAIVDGRPDAGQMLRAGQTYEFSGRTIALRIGDAGAVRVSVNGSEARSVGRDGQVVNRQYTLDGAAPAVAPSSSADPTDAPAPTPANPGPAAASSLPGEPLPAPSAPLLSLDAPSSPVAGTNGITTAPASFPVERESSPLPSPESAVVAAAQRWLDAYHRQDQATLAVLSAPDVVVADERPTGERMPVAAGAIARTLDRVNVQFAADTAVLTGVMTERVVDGGLQRSSPVSLVWVSSAGTWRLTQARLVTQSTLGQIFR